MSSRQFSIFANNTLESVQIFSFHQNYNQYSMTIKIFALFSFIFHLFSLRIPLSNLTDPDTGKIYPIEIDFNNKHTISPFRTKTLILSGNNLTIPMQTNYSSSVIKIGLEYPSDFITAVSNSLKIQPNEIQFTYKNNNQLELLISEVNLVEGRELFRRGEKMDYSIMYNYGNPIRIKQQTTKIIHGDKVLFNEYFILEVLNSMSMDNRISYNKSGDTIVLSGNLNNFPHIIALAGQNQVRLYLQNASVIYINTVSTANLIGILAVKDYSKFQVIDGGLLLKRSSLSIVLYIFLGVYAMIITGMVVGCWNDNKYTMGFIRNIFKATFFKDDRARVQLLMTELQ